MEVGGSVLIGVAGENVGDLIMDGKKSLHLQWRLEAFHNPLSSSRRQGEASPACVCRLRLW
jgi:hypothetical protein